MLASFGNAMKAYLYAKPGKILSSPKMMQITYSSLTL